MKRREINDQCCCGHSFFSLFFLTPREESQVNFQQIIWARKEEVDVRVWIVSWDVFLIDISSPRIYS